MLAELLVRDLAVVLIIAAIVAYIFHRLQQPVVLGYIIAGVIIGPYTPPFSYISQPARCLVPKLNHTATISQEKEA